MQRLTSHEEIKFHIFEQMHPFSQYKSPVATKNLKKKTPTYLT